MNQDKKAAQQPLTCGLVMPISAIDNCSAEHWAEVKTIITESVEGITEPKFQVKLVSEADDVGVIQKRIVQNVYSSDILVCDVSGKNANVMFELGMRLAFDKPTVLIKDDKTDYSFDTGVIEHLTYPRDLRFPRMVIFKRSLSEKVLGTYKAAAKESGHSTFLKNFGTFNVATLQQAEVSTDTAVLEMLADIQRELAVMRRRMSITSSRGLPPTRSGIRRNILDLILQFKTEHPSTPIQDSLELARYVESRLPAVDYFSSPSEFNSALETIVKETPGL